MQTPTSPVETLCEPVIIAFFDNDTSTISYLGQDPQASACAIIDFVLDFDHLEDRKDTASTDQIVAFDQAPGHDAYEWGTTVAAQKSANVHVRSGAVKDSFLDLGETRDAQIDRAFLANQHARRQHAALIKRRHRDAETTYQSPLSRESQWISEN